MLLTILVSVPVAVALAIVVELVANRGEGMQSWIEDAHPTFARPTPEVAPSDMKVALRPVGHRSTTKVTRMRLGMGRGAAGQQRRRALRLY